MVPLPSQRVRLRSASLLLCLPVLLSCAPLTDSWDRGLPKDGSTIEDRLWHVVFPLSVAAADQCAFEREETYGFFLADGLPSAEAPDPAVPSPVRIRYVHPALPAGRAGIERGDWVIAVNEEDVSTQPASAVYELIQRSTRARIQPLTLMIVRGSSRLNFNLWAVPSCRLMVKLLESRTVNALSDGSRILVTTALLDFLRSPHELGWVLAHELAHHALEHSHRARLQNVLSGFLAATVGASPTEVERIEFEREADRYGASLLSKAGFNLREARGFLVRLERYQRELSINSFAGTHPSTAERLNSFDRLVDEIERAQPKAKPGPLIDPLRLRPDTH